MGSSSDSAMPLESPSMFNLRTPWPYSAAAILLVVLLSATVECSDGRKSVSAVTLGSGFDFEVRRRDLLNGRSLVLGVARGALKRRKRSRNL